jgi:hypothetical protein
MANGVVVVCFAVVNTGRDIFLEMLEVELELPSDRAIREVMEEEAQRQGLKLSKFRKETRETIKAKRLRFFDNATQARGHTNDYYYRYDTWKETPVPSAWINEGTWIRCSVVSDDLIRQITEAAKQKGAYYTTKSEGELIVFPDLGLVVFSYYLVFYKFRSHQVTTNP